MRKILILLVVAFSFLDVNAQFITKILTMALRPDVMTDVYTFIPEEINIEGTDFNFYPMDDSRYEWSQSKSKSGQALMGKYGLDIVNKTKDALTLSTVELPIVVDSDDFVFGLLAGGGLSDDKGLILVFDYQSDRDFKAITIDGSQYKYMVYSQGVPSIVKTGLIKIPKGIMPSFGIHRNGSSITFFINNIEYGTFKNVEITNPIFGAGAFGKNKAIVTGMYFGVLSNENDIEQSTTPE